MERYAKKEGNTMKLNKGLRFIAFGFLFTLVNLNITTANYKVNITPDFIGWLLIFIGLGYMKERKGDLFFRIVAILLSLVTLAMWIVRFVLPKFDLRLYEIGVSAFAVLYITLLLGFLEKTARQCGSSHAGNLKIVKYVDLIVYILFQSISFAGPYLPENVLKVLVLVSGVAVLITAIMTAIVLFRLSFDVEEKEEF